MSNTNKAILEQANAAVVKGDYLEPPRFDVARLIAEGDFVTALGEIDITNGAGQTTRSVYCDVWRIRDGKLAERRAYVVEITGQG